LLADLERLKFALKSKTKADFDIEFLNQRQTELNKSVSFLEET
jgi:hypothetical protein